MQATASTRHRTGTEAEDVQTLSIPAVSSGRATEQIRKRLRDEAIFAQYKELVGYMLKRWAHPFCRTHQDYEDCEQAAWAAVYGGVITYDPSRGAVESTHVGWQVRGAISRWRDSMPGLRRSIRKNPVKVEYNSPHKLNRSKGPIRCDGFTPDSLSGQAQGRSIGYLLKGIGTARQRLIARLMFEEGMGQVEIAGTLGLHPQSVRSQWYALRDELAVWHRNILEA